MKSRQALAGKVAVLIDERDQREIDKRVDEEEEEVVEGADGPRMVNLSQQVSCRYRFEWSLCVKLIIEGASANSGQLPR